MFLPFVIAITLIVLLGITFAQGWGGIVPFEKINGPLEVTTHKVFLDISLEHAPPKRIHIALFGKHMPKMVENFRRLCTGEMGFDKVNNVSLHFKGTTFPRVMRYTWIEGGDLLNNECNHGVSAFGEDIFADNYDLGHNGMGYISMTSGRFDNLDYAKRFTSIFRIISRKLDHFNDKDAVIGRILYEDERLWLRNITRYHGNEWGPRVWKLAHIVIIAPSLEIVDSGQLPLDGNEDYILNPDLHKKDDL